jgi:UDP-N-acetylglucosamine 4,6-dehydratase
MKYLILGATGTLGRAMTKRLLTEPETQEVICLSRDELKLSTFELEFNDPRVKTVIGDVRDKEAILPHFEGMDLVFHFAALKRIPEMEKFPLESIKTNLLGAINAAEAAMSHRVPEFVFSSTDKACQPINTYGASKFLAEQILTNFNQYNRTNFSIYRWGNVLGSRGSVVHHFRDSLLSDQPAKITDLRMSRYWIKIEDAISFILETYKEKSNKVKIPKMKAASILYVLEAVARHLGKEVKGQQIGMRPGEKLHEDIRYIPKWNTTENSLDSEHYTHSELDQLIRETL